MPHTITTCRLSMPMSMLTALAFNRYVRSLRPRRSVRMAMSHGEHLTAHPRHRPVPCQNAFTHTSMFACSQRSCSTPSSRKALPRSRSMTHTSLATYSRLVAMFCKRRTSASRRPRRAWRVTMLCPTCSSCRRRYARHASRLRCPGARADCPNSHIALVRSCFSTWPPRRRRRSPTPRAGRRPSPPSRPASPATRRAPSAAAVSSPRLRTSPVPQTAPQSVGKLLSCSLLSASALSFAVRGQRRHRQRADASALDAGRRVLPHGRAQGAAQGRHR